MNTIIAILKLLTKDRWQTLTWLITPSLIGTSWYLFGLFLHSQTTEEKKILLLLRLLTAALMIVLGLASSLVQIVYTKNTSNPPISIKTIKRLELDDNCIEILIIFNNANGESLTVDKITILTKNTYNQTKHILNQLEKYDLISAPYNIDEEREYSLTDNGLKYLAVKGLL